MYTLHIQMSTHYVLPSPSYWWSGSFVFLCFFSRPLRTRVCLPRALGFLPLRNICLFSRALRFRWCIATALTHPTAYPEHSVRPGRPGDPRAVNRGTSTPCGHKHCVPVPPCLFIVGFVYQTWSLARLHFTRCICAEDSACPAPSHRPPSHVLFPKVPPSLMALSSVIGNFAQWSGHDGMICIIKRPTTPVASPSTGLDFL